MDESEEEMLRDAVRRYAQNPDDKVARAVFQHLDKEQRERTLGLILFALIGVIFLAVATFAH